MAESLIVELEANTQSFDNSINNSTQQVNNLSDEVSTADSSLGRFGKTAGAVGKALSVTATAGLALASAITAVVVNSAQANREVEQLARQAKLTTDEFDALAFATKQYGINAEQIADISKDLSDKLGEFTKTGKGAFQDFADVVGLSKEQAFLAAKEFENMSSDQVIGEMVRRMEDAGATTNEMTFALESMGNDLSKLQPLFANNSAELKTLTERYNEVNTALSLTNGEAKQLQQAATSFDLLTTSMGNAAELVSAQLAPMLDDFFNGVIDVVPRATQVVVDFINTFRSAENIESVDAVTRLLEDQKTKIEELTEAKNNAVGVSIRGMTADQNLAIQTANYNREIAEETKRLKELEVQLESLNSKKLEDAATGEGGSITATGGRLPSFVTGGDKEQQKTEAALQAIADRFKSEEQLLIEKFYAERELIAEDNELKLQLEQELRDNLTAIRLEAAEDQMALDEKAARANEKAKRDELKTAQKSAKAKERAEASFVNAALGLGERLFEDNKNAKRGMVLTDTAAGIMKAVSTSATIYDGFLNAATVGIMGVNQLAAIDSASSSGGGSSSAPAASASSGEGDASTATVISSDAGGSQTSIQITGDGDELIEAIAKAMKAKKLNGDF